MTKSRGVYTQRKPEWWTHEEWLWVHAESLPNGCITVPFRTSNGYPGFRYKGKNYAAHRYLTEQQYGKLPSFVDVCHTCDNRACINPEHLFLGTRKDNMQDAQAKGRTTLGEKHGNSKLTNADVLAIRRLAASNLPRKTIAAMYGVSRSYISGIATGRERRRA